jgi:FkbH-like protein
VKLIDALNLLKTPLPEGATPWPVALVCGFTPGHLETFLGAMLRRLAPHRRPLIQTGLFGDCLGNLNRLPNSAPESVVLIIEWSDLDPRLGLRYLGGWRTVALGDIVSTVSGRLSLFQHAIVKAAGKSPVVVCMPTLPLPPVSFETGHESGAFDLRLRELVWSFAACLPSIPRVRVVGTQRLDELSPLRDRLDVRAELSSGFPYRISHAATTAELLARLLVARPPKKGLISDLDDTLWKGILGEVGPQAISWDLDHHSQIHGLYQQLLNSLADAGVLIGVASKNEPQTVALAFERSDLIVNASSIFPIEAGWGPKSQSMERILAAWNISGDAAVFVDDSPMELDEVRSSHPGIECLQFPRTDEQAAYALLERLRDLFGKPAVNEEDGMRLASLRRAAELGRDALGSGPTSDRFLAEAEAEITVDFRKDPPDPRALELINKTNQFNLNGRRLTEGEWLSHLRDPEAFLLLASYKDKYGPLGKIAVVSGRKAGKALTVQQWVMSCRAFSRRIEHHCLRLLFDVMGVEQVSLGYLATPRNRLFNSFLAEYLEGDPTLGARITQDCLNTHCPSLYHKIKRLYDE